MTEAGAGQQPPAFTVAGYDVLELLGYGSGGEVWRGRCQTTGDAVALKRVRDVGDESGGYRLRREAATLVRIRHPHVLRLRTVVVDGDRGALVLVLDLAGGGSLARRVAHGGPLTAGQVVTVGVPLAQALAEVHEQGVLHGDVSPANVLFTSEGRPLLSDLGVARLVGGGREPLHAAAGFADPARDEGPADDVHGLAATCFAALTGHPPYDASGRRWSGVELPEELAEVLDAALQPDPSRRPSAAEFAFALYAAAPARPVSLSPLAEGATAGHPDPLLAESVAPPELGAPTHRVGPPHAAVAPIDSPRPARRHRAAAGVRRRATRGGLTAALVGAVLLTATATGLAWAQAVEGDRPATITRAAPVDWRAVLLDLDARRSRAYQRADLELLRSVYLPGSAAGRADARALQRLADADLRAVGVRLTPLTVTVVGQSRERARLRVRDVLAPYELRGGSDLVERRPGRGPATWLVSLRKQPGGRGWLISSVSRLGGGEG